MAPENKVCKCCKCTKPVDEFPIHDKQKNTRRTNCLECYNAKRKASYKDNIDDRREQNKESYYRNKDTRLIGVKRYAKNNPDKVKVWNKRAREKIIDSYREFKKTLSCEKCGENHPACLDFHHLDPENKENAVSSLVLYKKKLQSEITKCIVLCSNCHRKLHFDTKQETQ